MASFYRIKPRVENGDYAHRMLSWDAESDHSAEAYFAWDRAFSAAATLVEARAVPMGFFTVWDDPETAQRAELSDWPPTIFSLPVASKRVAEVLSDLAPNVQWIPLPPLSNGEPCGQGVLFGVQSFAINASFDPSQAPQFFASDEKPIDRRFFVSFLARQRLEEIGVAGIEFAPFVAGPEPFSLFG